jgi:hypothetical protein
MRQEDNLNKGIRHKDTNHKLGLHHGSNKVGSRLQGRSIKTGRLIREANKVINSIKEEEEEGSRRKGKMKVGNKISKQATLPTQGAHVQQEDQHLQAPCHGLGI